MTATEPAVQVAPEPAVRIALLPGDGVGEEVLDGPTRLLRALEAEGVVELSGPWPVGAGAAVRTGSPLPPATLAACDAADALLLGAVGDDPLVPPEACERPELALHGLRGRYDLRISIREIPVTGSTDLVVVRNLLGGAYGTDRDRGESSAGEEAWDLLRLTPERIAEVLHIACDLVERSPGGGLVSVDKANVFATSRLWRRVATDVTAARGVAVEHRYVDRAAFELAAGSAIPPVIATEGLFGDVLSDLAAGRAGSPALCGSSSVSPTGPTVGRCQGLFEPAHGSAPRRARRNQVNPLGGFLALTALLERFDATRAHGERLRAATRTVLRDGPWTYDLAPAGTPVASTATVADAVVAAYTALAVAGPAAPVPPPSPTPRGTGRSAVTVAARAPEPHRVPADTLERWTARVLEAVGVRAHHATATAEVLGYADLAGIDSHGVSRLPAYVRAVQVGAIATDAEPTLVTGAGGDGPVALVDGHDLLGHPVGQRAVQEAMARAARYGVGWVGVRRSSHYGAAGAYVRPAADAGLVALSFTNTGATVAPAGAGSPYLGTNPLAFAMPVAGEPPLVLDMATSAVSGGKFEIALREGTAVPHGWGLDGDGRPTRDPAQVFPGRGALLPLGSDPERSDHKGYGLALMVELLTAVLAGGPTGPAVGNLTFRAAAAAPGVSHAMVVLDPSRFGDAAEMSRRVAELLAGLRGTAPLDPHRPVRTPGQRSAREAEQRRRVGVPLHPDVRRQLDDLAVEVGCPLGEAVGA